MEKRTQEIIAELRRELARLYGRRLVRLVLFGSRARGDNRPDSDIDVLVVLNGAVDAGAEIRRTSGIVGGLSLKHDVVISRKFADDESYRARNEPLLRNIWREGITL